MVSRRKFVLGALVVGVPVVFAGTACGGGDDDDDTGGGGGTGTNSNPGTPAPTVVKERPVQVIEVTDTGFSPAEVTIKAGTRVQWKWTGTTNMHAVFISGAKSPEQNSGEFTKDFDQAGVSFSYQCAVHGVSESGRISVE